ncbi:MAG: RecX family transcriptional regulator [Clostridia bacterium]|nr:RecX family transcriptional regulator [Clostridia bacterium]
MGKITDIKLQAKNKERCNIYIDNSFCCGILLETVILNKLKVGLEISAEELGRIQLESEKRTVFDKTLDYISKTQKTEKQIKDKLKEKGYLKETIDYVIDKLKEYKFIDDFEYAKSYIRLYKEKKGKKLLEYELMQKGVRKQIIESVLEEENLDQKDACFTLLKKHLKNKEITRENLAKAYKYVLSKGFSYEEASNALSLLKEEDL